GEGPGARLWHAVLSIVTKVGQQSLAVFVVSMALAQLLGAVLDRIGRDFSTFALVNLTGLALITAVAYIAAWFKSQPWRKKRP
ncbi:MAG: OpgC domain-containing protein, partial [Sedimentitalea sp.]|nr:OpgC domain-containing protein [Sedimentitalea sp.]